MALSCYDSGDYRRLEQQVPTIAFLAHVDTAPALTPAGVKPIVHHQWDGKRHSSCPMPLSVVLSAKESPYLGAKVGEDIITASGTTLLGRRRQSGNRHRDGNGTPLVTESRD